jgi:hypothetical protein
MKLMETFAAGPVLQLANFECEGVIGRSRNILRDAAGFVQKLQDKLGLRSFLADHEGKQPAEGFVNSVLFGNLYADPRLAPTPWVCRIGYEVLNAGGAENARGLKNEVVIRIRDTDLRRKGSRGGSTLLGVRADQTDRPFAEKKCSSPGTIG